VAETDFCFWAVAKFVTSAVTNAATNINNAIRLTRYLLFSCNSRVLRNARLYRALRAGWPANSRFSHEQREDVTFGRVHPMKLRGVVSLDLSQHDLECIWLYPYIVRKRVLDTVDREENKDNDHRQRCYG